MKHARQKIREQVATTLAGIGVPVERSRVYSVVTPPLISVYANSERSESEVEAMTTPVRYSREMQLEIEVHAEAINNADDLADDYAAQIEALMTADLTLNNTATHSKLLGTRIDMDGGDKPIVVVRLTYEVWYRTTGTDPENPIVS